MRACDLAVILTSHSGVDHARLAEWAPIVVDTRNALPIKTNTIRA